jgi:hypothetical protein
VRNENIINTRKKKRSKSIRNTNPKINTNETKRKSTKRVKIMEAADRVVYIDCMMFTLLIFVKNNIK